MERQERRDVMCMFCKSNETVESVTSHVVNYNNCVIVIKNVPCTECVRCGEKFFSNEVALRLEQLVNEAKNAMQDVAVLDYSKVA